MALVEHGWIENVIDRLDLWLDELPNVLLRLFRW